MSAQLIEMNRASPDREVVRQWERDEVDRAVRDNKILSLSSRKRVAINLARLLHEVAGRERGLKTRIARLAWPNDEQALKKLDLVTLPSNAVPSSLRIARLAKKPRHYAGLARAIAQVARRSSQDVCVEIFRGTEIEAGASGRPRRFIDNQPEDWDGLAKLIETMTAAVVKRTGLRGHLQAIAGRTGTYRLDNEAIQPSRSPLLPHGPLTNGYEAFDEFPPIPSVSLFSMALADPFERILHLASADNIDRRIAVTVMVSREVRLAIGPADHEETPRPMFEIRTVVAIVDENQRNWADPRKWFYLNGEEEFTTADELGNDVSAQIDLGPEPGVEARWIPLLEDGNRSTAMSRDISYPDQVAQAIPNSDATGARQHEHVYATWLPVTSYTCSELLGMSFSEECFCSPEIDNGRMMTTLLPNNTVGSWVEAALSDEHRALEIRLQSEAERLVALVRNHIDQMRRQASEKHRSALARWLKDTEGEAVNND